ncbi:MAG: hypothetical protein CVU40_07830 [Chloroflexi bacterium HGW-Chloroflexi-2]|jgi:7-cyano-7-deazaguanine synthase|nr:MAG: hypothetical protein CVU40_07830 [Chloroflexi bacterium HGW-Chloroflexi-2]
MSDRCVILLSGGLDSTSLLYWAKKRNFQIYPLYINYGQIPFPGEWSSTKYFLKKFDFPEIEPFDVSKLATIGSGSLVDSDEKLLSDQYFPSRNLFLLILAAIYAKKVNASNILIGLIKDSAESLPDCSIKYIKRAQALLKIEYPAIQILTPFIAETKNKVVKDALLLGFEPEKTFCCNRYSDHHCWECPSCLDRLRIFTELGLI